MADQHEIIQDLKRVAVELGHAPSRDEYMQPGVGGFTRHQIQATFGTFSQALQAAGLKAEKGKRITNEIFFVKDIREHLVSHEPPKLLLAEKYPRIMSISDIHWPFEMTEVVDRFIVAVGKNQPEFVVLNGDAFDMYSWAKFPRSHNVFTPKEEEALAKEKNTDFWKRVRVAAPKAKCFQMLGNHDVRPLKRVIEQAPELEHWVQAYIKDLFTFEGVKTIHDGRQELIMGNVLAIHGHKSKLGEHRDYTRANCLVGHTHRGGVVFRNAFDITTNTQFQIWECNSGYAGNPFAKGLAYTPQRITEWTWGWSEVDERGPRFVPA